jgi:D-ribulokinase
MWMDHRAKDQANRISSQNHQLLKQVGGNMNPEMQSPKLMWLKENLPEQYQRAT